MKNKERKQKIIIVVLVALLVGALIYIVCLSRCGTSPQNQSDATTNKVVEDNNAIDYEGVRNAPLLPNGAEGIALPGFDRLVFVAGQKTQSVTFSNPEENNCYFVMSFLINDKKYWQSQYVAPGKCIYQIDLDNALEKGNYEGVLHVDCYDLDNATALNSADIKFILEVL